MKTKRPQNENTSSSRMKTRKHYSPSRSPPPILNARWSSTRSCKTAPYANQPAKLLAILNVLQKKAAGDIAEVSADNKTIRLCGGLLNQALSAAITHLESSPAQTAQLSSNGVNFSHPSLNEGKIQMGIDYDIAIVQIKLGSYVEKWKLRFEKEIEKEEPVW